MICLFFKLSCIWRDTCNPHLHLNKITRNDPVSAQFQPVSQVLIIRDLVTTHPTRLCPSYSWKSLLFSKKYIFKKDPLSNLTHTIVSLYVVDSWNVPALDRFQITNFDNFNMLLSQEVATKPWGVNGWTPILMACKQGHWLPGGMKSSIPFNLIGWPRFERWCLPASDEFSLDGKIMWKKNWWQTS